MISFTFRFLFSFVDLAYAGLLGRDEVAAIAYYIPFNAVYIAVWVGLSAGFTASLSAAFGHRDETRIRALKGSLLKILRRLVPSLALVGASLYFVVPHLGLEKGLADAFRIYGMTLLIGLPLTGFWSIYPDSVVKAHHDTRSTMIAGLLASVTNVLLNTLFVFAFGLGIFGIALATVLSRGVSLAYASHRCRTLENDRLSRDFDRGDQGPWPSPMRTILGLSVPASLTYALTAAEGTLINKVLTGMPDSTLAIASYGVYYQLLMLSLMPAIATSVAVLPYLGRFVPEGRHELIRQDLRKTMGMVAAIALLLTIPAGWFFARPLAEFFLAQGDSEVLELGPSSLQVLLFLPFASLAALPFLFMRPVFEALHQPRLGIKMSICRFVLFSLPLLVAGRYLAEPLGISPITGMVCGLILASAMASALTWHLASRSLRAVASAAPTRA